MPTVTAGKYIWQRWKNVWTNPAATTYTTPVLEKIAESVKEVTSKQAEFKQTLDEVSSTLTQTTTTANNALNKATTAQQNLDGFKTTVSNTYTTKTDFNNLSIGGRNLAQRTSSDYSSGYSSFSGVTNTCPGIGKVLTNGLAVGDTITVRLVYKYENIVAATGKTASCWIQGSGNTTGWSSGSFYGSPHLTISGSGEHIFNYSFTIAADHLKNSYWEVNIRHDYVQSGTVKWKMFKVEKGNKATDWTPAPEDIDDKFTKYSTTTQMNSAITQKANEITTSVSSTYVTKANANDTYATKSALSEVKQTADGLTTEVSKKLNSADLSSRIQQSATDIRIGFNGINNYISISDAMGIRVNHTDGSFSRINEDGFLHYNSGTGRRYHSLHTAGTIQLTGSGENENVAITLPAVFSKVNASDLILIVSMDGPRLWATDGMYHTEYYSVSNWANVDWAKNSSGLWTTSDVSGHYKVYNTATKRTEYLKAYITYLVLA